MERYAVHSVARSKYFEALLENKKQKALQVKATFKL